MEGYSHDSCARVYWLVYAWRDILMTAACVCTGCGDRTTPCRWSSRMSFSRFPTKRPRGVGLDSNGRNSIARSFSLLNGCAHVHPTTCPTAPVEGKEVGLASMSPSPWAHMWVSNFANGTRVIVWNNYLCIPSEISIIHVSHNVVVQWDAAYAPRSGLSLHDHDVRQWHDIWTYYLWRDIIPLASV